MTEPKFSTDGTNEVYTFRAIEHQIEWLSLVSLPRYAFREQYHQSLVVPPVATVGSLGQGGRGKGQE